MKVYVIPNNEEGRIQNFIKKAKEKAEEVWDWAKENPGLSVPIAIGIVSGMTKIGKGVIRHANLKQEEAVKNLYCYDRSLGHYWALRRELSNYEWLEIDRRRKNGERMADILAELRVLK